METEGLIFKRIIGKKGTSPASLTLPVELTNFLEIEVGETINMTGATGKHGRYVSIWKAHKNV